MLREKFYFRKIWILMFRPDPNFYWNRDLDINIFENRIHPKQPDSTWQLLFKKYNPQQSLNILVFQNVTCNFSVSYKTYWPKSCLFCSILIFLTIIEIACFCHGSYIRWYFRWNFRFTTAADLNKCLEYAILPISFYTCALVYCVTICYNYYM